MMWLLAGLAFIILWGFLSRMRSYRRLFADSHLMEFGQALPALKQAAMLHVMPGCDWDGPNESLECLIRRLPSPGDDRILETSAGLAFVYTVIIDPDGMSIHHASVSLRGRMTPHAVGETFILLWARLLGVDYRRVVLQVSPSFLASFARMPSATVHHGEFVLDADEQAELARRPVEMPTAGMLKAFQAECLVVRQNMRGSLPVTRHNI